MNVWNYNKDIGIDLNKQLGNTNTHHSIADIIVNDFVDFGLVTENTKFVEPAVGSGSFYFAILDELLELGFDKNYIIENMIYAYDIDNQALTVLMAKLSTDYNYKRNNQKIFHCDFLITKINEKFDYIITNPPYISSKHIKPENQTKENYIDNIKQINNIDFDFRSDIYMMFYLKTLELLNPKGKQIFLCSDSWLDCGYGDSLKKKIISDYSLDYIVNSQLYPFFRDDTNAIITVISKDSNPNHETKVISIKSNVHDLNKIVDLPFIEIKKAELNNLFKDKSILNKRNVLVLHGDKYIKNKSLMHNYANHLATIGSLMKVNGTGISQATLDKDGALLANDGLGVPLFWQIQARVNRKPNYKNKIENNELVYKIDESKIDKKLLSNIKDNSVYMSGIIDRFPLVFFTKGKSFHVSKYMHLDSDLLNPLEICLSINNIFTYYNMELDLKEGTRKTLRVGEMGLTKEIKKDDLKEIYCVDFTKFSKETRDEINRIGLSYQSKIIYNIEDALSDGDYLKIQELIKTEIKMSDDDFNYVKDELLGMYYFRMRNLAKLGLTSFNKAKPV